MELPPHAAALRQLTRTDPDPRVRHRADGLLLVAGGRSFPAAAARLRCSPNSLRAWARRFLADGRDGLLDRRRAGRPPALDATAHALLETALAMSPLEYHDPVTVWTVADLTDRLGRHGYVVSTATVYRTLHALGFVYRRPRHDLTHRQDADAVASATHVLAELQKRGLLPGLDSAWSTWMRVTSTPTLTWSRSGSARAVR